MNKDGRVENKGTIQTQLRRSQPSISISLSSTDRKKQNNAKARKGPLEYQ